MVADRVRLRLIREEMRQARQIGRPWLDRWIWHLLAKGPVKPKQIIYFGRRGA